MRNGKTAILSAIVMLALPWLAVSFVPADGGMAVALLLFFAVNPVYTIAVGIFAGNDVKSRWFQPILTSLLFLAGGWLIFAPLDTAFLLYAGAYLLLGLLAMGITRLFRTRKTT